MSPGVLDEIVAGVREDLAEREARRPLPDLVRAVRDLPPTRDPLPRFRAGDLAVIAEVKRSSPSRGALADIVDPARLAGEYAAGGAAAISVLTEGRRFGGSLDDLRAVRAGVDVPILRKDFIVADYQLYEAREAGADLALLIVASLTDAELRRLLDLCRELTLTPLVEVHTEPETARALETGAELLGVNNRNLRTLDVDLTRFEKLVSLIPPDRVKVAESGIMSTVDVSRVAQAGADVILVGEALVTGGNPRQAVADFVEAGSAARGALRPKDL